MYPGLRNRGALAPLVMVIDDLQWADVASTELLLHLLALTEEVPILFLCAFRPERQSPAWRVKVKAETDYPHRYTEIDLRPLATDDADIMVSSLLGSVSLPDELHRLILRKAEGNPYFVEEIVRCLKDQGAIEESEDGLRLKPGVQIDQIAIPDSLQALLMARIDRLDEETRSTLQMASVIGRSFYYRILQAISDSAMAIDRQLGALERVELLTEAARVPELEYMFKHELARDAAYATILNRRRRAFHLRVAEAIESVFADRLEEFAHRLAQHFEAGGDLGRAMKYYEMAGAVAEGIHANDEGAAHFAHALEMAREIDAPEADIARLAARRSGLEAGRIPAH
jgi:predicted ATPase